MLSPSRLRLRPTDPEQSQALGHCLDLPPVLAQLLLQRHLTDAEQARSFLYDEADQLCHDPGLLPDLPLALDFIGQALESDELIMVHGDYDVDGICSTVVLLEGLRELGGRADYHVPDRFSEGYGVSLAAVERAAQLGARLLLTCDCGSSSHRAIERAQQLGLKVVVTDHHTLPSVLPQPQALVNPQRDDSRYPFRSLCGAGVAYKLLCALFQRRGLAWPSHFLDLVAVATIADVMPLLGENRGLVRSGLKRLAELGRPGFRALAQVAGLEKGPWGSFAVGFGLGPRLNAAGRLEHARLGVELLLCQDPHEARNLAQQLDGLNQQRRELESQMRQEVEERLTRDPAKLELGVVVEAGEDWHQGVVGITASRVVDRYGLPAFIMARVGDRCHGSARSPENVNLHEAMQECAEVFIKFGGHARAAGFTVAWERVDEMRQKLAKAVAKVRQGPAPLWADLELDLPQADLDLARQLKLLEPLGEGNRSPVFLSRGVRLDRLQLMGATQEHLRCYLVQESCKRKAVAFRLAGDRPQILDKQLAYDVLYELEEENWEGHSSPSLRILAFVEPQPQLFGLLRGQVDRSSQCPQMIDGRNVISRRGYLEGLFELGLEPLLVVHNQVQGERVAEALARYRPQLVRYPELTSACEDVALLYPPSSWEDLHHPALRESRRLHILFGSQELRREQERQSSLWLDRPRLEGIWRLLRRRAQSDHLATEALGGLEADLKPLKASVQALQQAVAVFEELELVERRPTHWILRPSNGRRLEDSRLYQQHRQGQERFLQLMQRFDQGPLSWEPKLAPA